MLLGVPRFAGESIAASASQANEWLGLGHFLEDAAFHTSRFHGAVKGTMDVDAIAGMAGIRDFSTSTSSSPARPPLRARTATSNRWRSCSPHRKSTSRTCCCSAEVLLAAAARRSTFGFPRFDDSVGAPSQRASANAQ
ncbi:MAG TPA: hypothetical protein VK936_11000 [Longimicrobiales bacterium]|nr:hypothetical protein [Longimicrobiales bacterium]